MLLLLSSNRRCDVLFKNVLLSTVRGEWRPTKQTQLRLQALKNKRGITTWCENKYLSFLFFKRLREFRIIHSSSLNVYTGGYLYSSPCETYSCSDLASKPTENLVRSQPHVYNMIHSIGIISFFDIIILLFVKYRQIIITCRVLGEPKLLLLLLSLIGYIIGHGNMCVWLIIVLYFGFRLLLLAAIAEKYALRSNNLICVYVRRIE